MMKTLKQIIATAGFASLLFAPLAQAALSDQKSVGLLVLGSGISITEASEVNFGEVTLEEDTDAELTLSCVIVNQSTAALELGSSVAPKNANSSLDLGGGECGVITVEAGNADIRYQLEVAVDDLISGANTISPELLVYKNDGHSSAGPDSSTAKATPGAPVRTAIESLAASATATFRLGGVIDIVGGIVSNPPGNYTGNYTVTAYVQE